VGAADVTRLTTDRAEDDAPAWSPDGRKIAFVRTNRSSPPRSAIYVVPAAGGPERRVAELMPSECYPFGTLSWSRDGQWLAFSDKTSHDGPFALYMISLETGEQRKLTSVNPGLYGDAVPAFSPDGLSLAFVRLSTSSIGELYVVSRIGGQPRRLTNDAAGVFGLAWNRASTELVFCSGRSGEARLWRIAASGGTPQPLTGISGSDLCTGVSQAGNRLVFAHPISDQNIWRVGIEGAKMIRPPEQLISSTRDDTNPQPSPDGTRVAFSSNRSGAMELWVSDSDGKRQIQLTNFGKGVSSWPTWSPDGNFIAFNSDTTGHLNIFAIDAQGGSPRRLTTDAENAAPSWSRDGRWIYYISNRTGTLQIWKIAPRGGVPIQVTKGGGSWPAVSPDGKLVYYARGEEIWRVPADGGDEVRALGDVPEAGSAHWVPAKGGIYFRTQKGANAVLRFFDFSTSRTADVMPVTKPWDVSALAASSDGRWLLFDQIDQSGSDLMLIENLR
jgi:Tol biopolymer transport system component